MSRQQSEEPVERVQHVPRQKLRPDSQSFVTVEDVVNAAIEHLEDCLLEDVDEHGRSIGEPVAL